MTQDIRNRIMQFVTKPVAHDVPDFGTVYLRRMTLGEMDTMQQENNRPVAVGEKPVPLSVRLLARFLGDENGLPLFDLSKADDMEALRNFPVSVAAELLKAGNKVNGMNVEADPGKA